MDLYGYTRHVGEVGDVWCTWPSPAARSCTVAVYRDRVGTKRRGPSVVAPFKRRQISELPWIPPDSIRESCFRIICQVRRNARLLAAYTSRGPTRPDPGSVHGTYLAVQAARTPGWTVERKSCMVGDGHVNESRCPLFYYQHDSLYSLAYLLALLHSTVRDVMWCDVHYCGSFVVFIHLLSIIAKVLIFCLTSSWSYVIRLTVCRITYNALHRFYSHLAGASVFFDIIAGGWADRYIQLYSPYWQSCEKDREQKHKNINTIIIIIIIIIIILSLIII